jgi:hypothetical protein
VLDVLEVGGRADLVFGQLPLLLLVFLAFLGLTLQRTQRLRAISGGRRHWYAIPKKKKTNKKFLVFSS